MAARLVALEWDSAEARVAIGRVRGRDLVLEHAFAVDLSAREESSGNLDDAEVGARLATALGPYRLGRQEALVAVGRTSIELRRLQLPPAPDEELPDMVRFQAMRQFSTIGEQWPIDFVPLARTEANIDVLAAAISPAIVESIQKACGAAELTPTHLVLRPFAAAALLEKSRATDDRCRLLVDLLAAEADLSVLVDGVVAFVRTVRLPPGDGASPVLIQALLGEIRRTIPAAQSQLGGKRIEVITFCGDDQAHKELIDQLAAQLPLPVESIDPFSAVQVSSEAQRNLPSAKGRYAPLLGMMLTVAAGEAHAVDFLHPRQRPQTKSSRERRLAMITAAVAVVCLLLGGVKWFLNKKEASIVEMERQVAAAKPTVQAAKKQIEDLEAVEQFIGGRIDWLEELAHLSREMPPPDDAIVSQLTAALQRSGEGRLTIDGYVKESEHIGELENNLRTDRHRVEGSNRTQDPTRNVWNFKETVFIDPAVPLVASNTEPAEESESEPPPAEADEADEQPVTQSDDDEHDEDVASRAAEAEERS